MSSYEQAIKQIKTKLSVRQIVFALFLTAMATTSSANDTAGQSNAQGGLPSLTPGKADRAIDLQERLLGQAWLRQLRSQVTIFQDPVVIEYFKSLLYDLAPYSNVSDKDFSVVIVDSKALNAFAVPGSVVGINGGLFIHTESEQEFASVIAHELAHIGQRHYSRRLQKQAQSTPLVLAGILASVVLAATAGSEAGIAALSSTQALGVSSQLSFSRQNEEEADRLGIKTLYEAGYDPRAMPVVFDRMNKLSRLQGGQPLEYLSTHPLSESRIADTGSRASQYPKLNYSDSVPYNFAKAIVINHYLANPNIAIGYFEALENRYGNDQNAPTWVSFGMAIAKLDTKPGESLKILENLLQKHPSHNTLQIKRASALLGLGKTNEAIDLLVSLQQLNPESYSVNVSLAESLMEIGQADQAVEAVRRLVKHHPEQLHSWYLAAEVYGKAGMIVELHRARAEFYLMTNRFELTQKQLRLAKDKSKTDNRLQAIIDKRIEEVKTLKKNNPLK